MFAGRAESWSVTARNHVLPAPDACVRRAAAAPRSPIRGRVGPQAVATNATGLVSGRSPKGPSTLMPRLPAPAALLSLAVLALFARTSAADDVDMAKVRALAVLPVKEILRDSPVHELSRASYWTTINKSPIPVVVFFYSNVDGESQRLATLVRYVAMKYVGKFSAYGVMVADTGKPTKTIAAD